MRRREFPLTIDEQDRIDELEEAGCDVAQIACRLSRSRRSIRYYIHHRPSHFEEDGQEDRRASTGTGKER
jgi:IS30 family transposase